MGSDGQPLTTLVGGKIKAVAREVHRQAHDLVDAIDCGVEAKHGDHKGENPRVLELEPHLGDD